MPPLAFLPKELFVKLTETNMCTCGFNEKITECCVVKDTLTEEFQLVFTRTAGLACALSSGEPASRAVSITQFHQSVNQFPRHSSEWRALMGRANPSKIQSL